MAESSNFSKVVNTLIEIAGGGRKPGIGDRKNPFFIYAADKVY